MEPLPFNAVVVTYRDYSESIEAVTAGHADACSMARDLAFSDPRRQQFVRVWVKTVSLTVAELVALVERWGRRDALAGTPVSDPDAFVEPLRSAYLRAYRQGS